MKRVLCVGDACADLLIPYGHARNGREAKVGFAPGGTVANTASGLGRLGADCAFAGVAGQDEYGEEMKNSLALDGVDVSRFRLREGLPSTMVMVVLDENQERYPFLLPRDRQAHLELRREDLPESLLEGVDYVHTSGLMLFENPAAEAVCAFLELCKRRGVRVSIDINLRVETARRDMGYFRRAMACADYLLGSALDELAPLTGLRDWQAAARGLVTPRRAVVARLGSGGAKVFSAQGESSCPGFAVSVQDTLGAGDCYNAGFLLGLTLGHPLSQANRMGCAAAAISVTRPGARSCPDRQTLENFLANQGENA